MDEIKFLEEGVDYPKQTASDDDAVCYDEVTLAAQKAFHITYLFPWQRIVIGNILDAAFTEDYMLTENDGLTEDCVQTDFDGNKAFCVSDDDSEKNSENDVFCRGKQIVLLPTGAGKSLCFLTPALLLTGPTLVLYPLIALMTDQKRRMDEGGLTSVVFRGGQSAEEREENFRQIKAGAKIILANPEVLQNESLVKRLSECHIAHIAIDEAHCVSEWGDTFRPAYLTLGKIIKNLKVNVVTAFTATASPQVLQRVAEVLFDGKAHIVRSDSDRPNIHYYVENACAKKRAAFKMAIRKEKPLIVFCGTRKHAEDMARELSMYYGSDRVKFYHAGLEKEEKDFVEKWFYPKKDAILCCTCAFGMGVDKKDIHNVIHLDSPTTAEAYIQEAGRGGRDGSIADGTLLWSLEDSKRFDSYEKNSRQRVLKTFAEALTCRRQILLDALGGEQAYCDGCDVCERGGKAPFAEDALLALKYIRAHRKMFTRIELIPKLTKYFNELDVKEFGINIWDHSDTEEIINQLEKAKYLRTCLWPWYKKIDCVKVKVKSKNEKFQKDPERLSRRYESNFWKKLETVQGKVISVKMKIIRLLHFPETLLKKFLRFLKNLLRFLKNLPVFQEQEQSSSCEA